MSAKDDLETATCTVLVDFNGNHYLIDRAVLDAKLTKETTESMRSYGIRVVAGSTRTMLGGGGETILSALKALLAVKDYVGLLIAIFQVPIKLYKAYLDKSSKKQRPAVNICLTLSSKKELDLANFYDDLSNRLSVLSKAANVEAKRLQGKYPMYLFNQKVSIDLPAHGFSATYITAADKNTPFSQNRMLKVTNALKFQEGLNININFAQFGLIEHSFAPQTLILESPHRKKDWRYVGSGKKFYTLVSSRILGGYMQKTPTMPYKEYYQKHLRPNIG